MDTDVVVGNGDLAGPTTWSDHKALPKRQAVRTVLPLSWQGRVLEVDFVGPDGKATSAKGTYLDWCTSGPILDVEGTKTVICFERICTVGLVPD